MSGSWAQIRSGEIPDPVMNQTLRWLSVQSDQGNFGPGVSTPSPSTTTCPHPGLGSSIHQASDRVRSREPPQGSSHPAQSPVHLTPYIALGNLTPSRTPAPLGGTPCTSHWQGTDSDPLSWSPCSHSALPPTLGPYSAAKMIF